MKKKKMVDKQIRKGVLCTFLFVALFVLVLKYREVAIYDKLDVNISKDEFEYGNEINLKKYVTKKDKGYKYSVLKNLNTSQVGKQQVEVKVEYKGVAKVIPLSVNVVDTSAPVIEIKEDSITIDEDQEYALSDNISSVVDNSGTLEYKDESSVVEGDVSYYTIHSNGFDYHNPGEYTVVIVAVDGSGNKTEKEFKINVKEKVRVVVQQPQQPSYNNNVVVGAAPNAQGGDIVSIAYSYLGYAYTYAGNSPATGFDCSGFVQYVYSQVGKSVSRSANTQAYDGVGVSYDEMQPGDILSWGHGGMVTHSAIYVGDGQMIHAMNSNTGVVISPVNGWTNYDTLMSIRRVA